MLWERILPGRKRQQQTPPGERRLRWRQRGQPLLEGEPRERMPLTLLRDWIGLTAFQSWVPVHLVVATLSAPPRVLPPASGIARRVCQKMRVVEAKR